MQTALNAYERKFESLIKQNQEQITKLQAALDAYGPKFHKV